MADCMLVNNFLKNLARKIIIGVIGAGVIEVICLGLGLDSELKLSDGVQAASFGVHLLHTEEIETAIELLMIENEERVELGVGEEKDGMAKDEVLGYLTIPFTINDAKEGEADRWRKFFQTCKKNNLVPLVRLSSTYEAEINAWKIPNRGEIIEMINFLSELEWPQERRHLIVFNEVNHAKEWGGKIDPAGYVEMLRFVSAWARSEGQDYYILGAAMDLAAGETGETIDAFRYLDSMLEADEGFLDYIDGWNSHSYPNPGFSASPAGTGQNSIRGFEHELAWLSRNDKRSEVNLRAGAESEAEAETKSGEERKWEIYITETGWVENAKTRRNLRNYYIYALKNVWSNPAVVAVTPFLLQGDPGPFAGFSFIDKEGRETWQYEAYQTVLLLARGEGQSRE